MSGEHAAEMLFLGDVYLPFHCEAELPLACLTVVNLEFPITRSARGEPGKVNLKAADNYLRSTFGPSPLAVCLANNHVFDYGQEGFEETLASLAQDGILHFGAGFADQHAGNPLIFPAGKVPVALLGYCWLETGALPAAPMTAGVAPLDVGRILGDMARARSEGAERVVVCLHWGVEDVYLPRWEDIQTAHILIDAGADLVVGHHAHRIQPIEQYRDRFISYGLGNCIMPDLDVPAYCDPQSGTPTGRFRKRQHVWNRRSLGILYHAEANRVRCIAFEFTKGQLRQIPFDDRRYRLSSYTHRQYERVFRRSFVRCRIEQMVRSFLAQPKWPRTVHLRTLLRTLMVRDTR